MTKTPDVINTYSKINKSGLITLWEIYFYYGALLAYVLSLVIYLTFASLRKPFLLVQGELAFTIGFIFNTLTLVTRWHSTGSPPLGSQFEFVLCLAWVIAVGLQILAGKYRYKALGVFIMPLILGFYLYSTYSFSVVTAATPVNGNRLLSIHLALAVLGYGAFGVAFGLACPRLLEGRWKMGMSAPVREATDALLFRLHILGFGLLTLVIITGGTWSWIAYNSVLTWDPAQTWPLITWIIYGASVYTIFTGKNQGKSVAWLAVFGFICVMVTVFGGNLLVS